MNRLASETSPYLLQHAHNPVDWYPWGEEALLLAKQQDKPILVSIGYSACHWCHVMERESFEDPATAAFMNEAFVNVKIDREERPDLDHIYMDAVQAISGSGGWPLNVFLTPEAKPFYGSTYFPPVRAHNRPSWMEVLSRISRAFREERGKIEEQAQQLTDHLSQQNQFGTNALQVNIPPEERFTYTQLHQAFEAAMGQADTVWGGFGKAPKFPQTFTLNYLLRYHFLTGRQDALDQALLSLDKMIQGGIYDHLRGGFARYSTDTEWLAPHFEKMLYDNALLVLSLCEAFQVTANPVYEKIIRQTLGFVTD
ncbi:MAG: thioredoxin domain-containing protein, partial [Chitinophagaceae bacterium]